MKVENLHDAIGQLPSDLIAETDRRRSRPRRRIPWQRYGAMAACLALILCASYALTLLSAPKSCDTAAQNPEMMRNELTGEGNYDAAPAEAAPMEVPAALDVGEQEAMDTYAAAEDTANGSHTHNPLEEALSRDKELGGWCGNMTATVFYGEEIRTLEGESAIALADILYFLDYQEENLCRCDGEFTVDIETGDLYEVGLSQYFVRCHSGQANLTEEQARTIEDLLNGMEEEP